MQSSLDQSEKDSSGYKKTKVTEDDQVQNRLASMGHDENDIEPYSSIPGDPNESEDRKNKR